MRVHNVHARELPVPAEQVGGLLDGLGGPDDRLWPSDRWPTTPLVLEGPLAVGTPSRQGLIAQTLIRQRVEEYQPGKRVVFRFTPGLGLVGSHRLEVEPLGTDRARLTHTLTCRVEPKLLPLYPIFIRQHDALVEDLFDRAELQVTGRLARPARWPVSVRLANAVELGIARRQGLLPPASPARAARRKARLGQLARIGGVLGPSALAALAALHAAWALGWRWPGDTDHALAELVLSSSERERLMTLTGSELPPDPVTWAVAAALLAAAGIVATAATGRLRSLRLATWGVAGVLLARGGYGISTDLLGGVDELYERLDLALYSPLCLALGTATAAVAWRAGAPLGRRPVPAGAPRSSRPDDPVRSSA